MNLRSPESRLFRRAEEFYTGMRKWFHLLKRGDNAHFPALPQLWETSSSVAYGDGYPSGRALPRPHPGVRRHNVSNYVPGKLSGPMPQIDIRSKCHH